MLVLGSRDLQTFLSKSYICNYTTVREPDILRNVIVSGYVTFYRINKCFLNVLFFINDKMSLRSDEMASRAVVW